MIIVYAGVASLACIIDGRAAHRAPLPFAVFLFGVGAFVSTAILESIGSTFGGFGNTLGFLGLGAGGIGGAMLGYWLGIKRKRHYQREQTSRCQDAT
jgi:hypothetical protein